MKYLLIILLTVSVSAQAKQYNIAGMSKKELCTIMLTFETARVSRCGGIGCLFANFKGKQKKYIQAITEADRRGIQCPRSRRTWES